MPGKDSCRGIALEATDYVPPVGVADSNAFRHLFQQIPAEDMPDHDYSTEAGDAHDIRDRANL